MPIEMVSIKGKEVLGNVFRASTGHSEVLIHEAMDNDTFRTVLQTASKATGMRFVHTTDRPLENFDKNTGTSKVVYSGEVLDGYNRLVSDVHCAVEACKPPATSLSLIRLLGLQSKRSSALFFAVASKLAAQPHLKAQIVVEAVDVHGKQGSESFARPGPNKSHAYQYCESLVKHFKEKEAKRSTDDHNRVALFGSLNQLEKRNETMTNIIDGLEEKLKDEKREIKTVTLPFSQLAKTSLRIAQS